MAVRYFKDNVTNYLSDTNNWYTDSLCTVPLYQLPDWDNDDIYFGNGGGSNVTCYMDSSTTFAGVVTIGQNAVLFVGVIASYSIVDATFNNALIIEQGGQLATIAANSANSFSTVYNYGACTFYGPFYSWAGDFYNYGYCDNHSTFTLNFDASAHGVYNYFSFTNDAAGLIIIYNNCSFYNVASEGMGLSGTFINVSGALLQILSGGTFNNELGTILNIYGDLTNYSQFNNYGSVVVYSSGNFANFENTACNYNTFTNGGTFVNNANFYNYNRFINTLNAYNSYYLLNAVNGTIVNNNSFTNYENGIIDNAGVATNSSLFTNNGQLTSANFSNSGTLANNNNFINGGVLSNALSGTIINNGILNNNGNLSLNTASTLTNNGTFKFSNNYTTRFKGNVFPQVPSSAAFGAAVIF